MNISRLSSVTFGYASPFGKPSKEVLEGNPFSSESSCRCEGGQHEKTPNNVVDAINANTEALKDISKQIAINSSVLYGIEKSKSRTLLFHKNAFSETSSPEEFIAYVNSNM